MTDYTPDFVDKDHTDFTNAEIEVLVHDYTPLFGRLEALLQEKKDDLLYSKLLQFGIDLSNFCGAIGAQIASEGTYVHAVPLPDNFTRVTKERLIGIVNEITEKHVISPVIMKDINV